MFPGTMGTFHLPVGDSTLSRSFDFGLGLQNIRLVLSAVTVEELPKQDCVDVGLMLEAIHQPNGLHFCSSFRLKTTKHVSLIHSVQSLTATASNALDAFSANDVPATGPNFKVTSVCIIIDRKTKPQTSMRRLYKTLHFFTYKRCYQILLFYWTIRLWVLALQCLPLPST